MTPHIRGSSHQVVEGYQAEPTEHTNASPTYRCVSSLYIWQIIRFFATKILLIFTRMLDIIQYSAQVFVYAGLGPTCHLAITIACTHHTLPTCLLAPTLRAGQKQPARAHSNLTRRR